VLAVGALVLAGALATWFMRPTVPAPTGASAAPSAAGVTASRPRELPATFDARAVVRKEAGTVELCGYGSFAVQPGGELYPPHVQQRAEQTLQRALTQAIASPSTSPVVRAAALYASPAFGLDRPRPPDEACERNPTCLRAAESAALAAYASGVRRLVQAATASRDGTAYGLALAACQRSVGDAASPDCAALSAGQWAQLDPDNLIAGIAAAREAEQRGDPAGFEAALARAARATQSRWPMDALLALATLPEVRNSEPAVRLAAAGAVMQLQASSPIPLLLSPDLCNEVTLRDNARRTACASIAENQSRSASTLLELTMLEALGRRLSWPDARLTALRDERDALRQIGAALPADLWTCNADQRLTKLHSTWAQRGELAALRELQAASGLGTAELAAQWRASAAGKLNR
jgi:hypothetical protein